MISISAEQLSCQRGLVPVFEDVSFALHAGGCMVITGANGSGKSSLLRMMAGLLKPVSGEVSGYEKSDLHYIGTSSALKNLLTVQENLQFSAKILGHNRANIEKALVAMNITHLEQHIVGSLSSGQVKRASLSRLFLAHRSIWLLDEPENALDVKHREQLRLKIEEHLKNQGIVVIATHNAEIWPATDYLDMDQFTRGAS